MPFDDAVQFAARALFGKADLERFGAPRDDGARIPLVIDPLVDGNTGFQSTATAQMEQKVARLVREAYPRFELQPFTTATLARGPLLFIGTFTAVDKDGKAEGPRDWYRVCLALVDLRTGRIVSKGFARSAVAGVDTTPAALFADSPAWAPDAATQGYVKTCQGTKPGDPINPAYWDRIIAAAMVNDATIAYNAGRYDEALDLYKGVQRLPGGDQLRVHNGIYLSATKLGRRDDAVQAFARLVDFGLAQKQLGIKFLFRPGSTQFLGDPQISGPYPLWLSLLAQRAGRRSDCIEVGGHTSRTGPEPLNDRLSLLRAQSIKVRIDALVPDLAARTTAIGKGSHENISGLGTDDARDALDRRVEFKVRDCRRT
jgi:outer membrane protein OmpA-like peptidoglycan-associated protein